MKTKEIDLIEQGKRFWEWLFGIQHWNTIEGWIARVLVWIIVVYLLLLLLKHLLEIVVHISECWKSMGFDVKKSPEEAARIRRRQQFSKVLLADLATLAKAESWNDQFFTDLEAEVEAEGSYYASRVDRLLRRKSQGLRRVPSLIQAIESSTEQCLLVTGEPGSGKSVALRHLANQLAEKASKSKSADTKIPLYVNLKELPEAPAEGPSADFIREFVLENIRRGDADTAAYVRENWSMYRERGHWFFLFDSFDEIPAVLHAPSGSPAIQQHADAIRQFFEGMSSCQGVLASREFKGPDALPWKRFRILPLSSSRQDELIDNSFLPPEQKILAAQHVAASGPGFLTNPLFLTLLCRYVKEEGKVPTNDNELLLKHIQRLAHREPEYVKRKYGLTPAQLLHGSIELSVLFAEQPSLSLAPTQDQISQAVSPSRINGYDLEKLLAALIDVKIGRCDVREARAGDRRFTFAHRRYQETLFVEYLVKNPGYLSSRDLLTDLRWRDYTVTLFQTSSASLVMPLFAAAAEILRELASSLHGISVLPEYNLSACYFEWRDSPGAQLLRLLQEGVCRRLEIVPKELRESVKRFLDIPWRQGDAFDRLMVISLGGLMPEADLQEKIRWAIRRGTIYHWDSAVTASFFLQQMPEEVAGWFRVQLANRLLFARHRADILRLEAIAARSPVNIGAPWIVHRVRSIRGIFKFLDPLGSRLAPASVRDMLQQNERVNPGMLTSMTIQVYMVLIPVLLIYFGGRHFADMKIRGLSLVTIGTWILVKVLRRLWLLWFRAVGEKLTLRSVAAALAQARASLAKLLPSLVFALLGVVGGCGAIGGAGYYIALKFGYSGEALPIVAGVPTAVMLILFVGSAIFLAKENRTCLQRLRTIQRDDKTDVALVLRASSWEEVETWLRFKIADVIPSDQEGRSFLRVLRAVSEKVTTVNGSDDLRKDALTVITSKRLTRMLIARVCKLTGQSADVPSSNGPQC